MRAVGSPHSRQVRARAPARYTSRTSHGPPRPARRGGSAIWDGVTADGTRPTATSHPPRPAAAHVKTPLHGPYAGSVMVGTRLIRLSPPLWRDGAVPLKGWLADRRNRFVCRAR